MQEIREMYKNLSFIWGYARTSGQVNPKDSIPNQCTIIYSAAEEEGVPIQGIWIDEMKTGTNTNREGYQNLLKLIKIKKVNLVLVTYFDRLSRQAAELIRLLLTMQSEGIECMAISEDKRLSLMSLADIAAVAIQAEEENKARTKRLAQSRKESKSRGEHINLPPLGYKRDENRQLVVDNTEAVIIKQIFNLYDSGESFAEIQRYLKSHHPTERSWNLEYIKEALTRRLYTGKKYRKYRDEEGLVRYEKYSEVEHEAIIDEKLFMRVASRVNLAIQKNAASRGVRTKLTHIFKGVLMCGWCANEMKAKRLYYYCSNENCHASRLRKEIIEPPLLEYVRQLDEPDTINSLNKQREYYTQQLNSIEVEREYLLKQFAVNKISTVRFKERLFLLAQKSKEINEEIDVGMYLNNQVPYGELINQELYEQLNQQLVQNEIKLTFTENCGRYTIKRL